MHLTTLAIFFELSRTAFSTCAAGAVLFVIAAVAARNDVAQARGLDKAVALGYMLFAMPLAIFGAEHLSAAQGISQAVPSFMPWPLFWTYLVGFALIAASLSIATKIQIRWSGLFFGIMMFSFVAMMDIPGVIQKPHDRFGWALLLRELSFGSGGWLFSASATDGWQPRAKSTLITVGRIVLGISAIFYGVEHFLHPWGMPGVPLEKEMPAWIPLRALIGYLTGAMLLGCGVCILLAKKTRLAAAYLGAFIALEVLVIYGPVLILALLDPSTAVKVEGINYFGDTMLYAGTTLGLAIASPQTE
ncbi:MAG TPA: hypothetical protein VMH04_14865 [Candidatus Solibacter sp.]|nr:hypothetical protein [Candidatus Solibacter sp.]